MPVAVAKGKGSKGASKDKKANSKDAKEVVEEQNFPPPTEVDQEEEMTDEESPAEKNAQTAPTEELNALALDDDKIAEMMNESDEESQDSDVPQKPTKATIKPLKSVDFEEEQERADSSMNSFKSESESDDASFESDTNAAKGKFSDDGEEVMEEEEEEPEKPVVKARTVAAPPKKNRPTKAENGKRGKKTEDVGEPLPKRVLRSATKETVVNYSESLKPVSARAPASGKKEAETSKKAKEVAPPKKTGKEAKETVKTAAKSSKKDAEEVEDAKKGDRKKPALLAVMRVPEPKVKGGKKETTKAADKSEPSKSVEEKVTKGKSGETKGKKEKEATKPSAKGKAKVDAEH